MRPVRVSQTATRVPFRDTERHTQNSETSANARFFRGMACASSHETSPNNEAREGDNNHEDRE